MIPIIQLINTTITTHMYLFSVFDEDIQILLLANFNSIIMSSTIVTILYITFSHPIHLIAESL